MVAVIKTMVGWRLDMPEGGAWSVPGHGRPLTPLFYVEHWGTKMV